MNKIGIDIVQVERIKLEVNWIKKILHPDEYVYLERLESENAKKEFLAGRWAAKEAIIKVIDENIAPQSISIQYNGLKPIVVTPKLAKIEISISHEREYAVAVALNL